MESDSLNHAWHLSLEVVRDCEMKYKNRPYLRDFKTGEVLDETVMYDNSERIVGFANVASRLRRRLLSKAKEFGGRNLKTRMFIDAFKIRGPSYGDVVRQVMRELKDQDKIQMRNIGTEEKPRYVYDVV